MPKPATRPLLTRPFSAGDFPELDELNRLIERGGSALRSDIVCTVQAEGEILPVHVLELGNPAPHLPAVGFFGGVHGMERIGAQVVIAFLHSLIERLHWDDTLTQLLERVRLVFMPLVNPGGVLARTRCNPQGVDLMRNAPVDSTEPVPFLLGGQRHSRHLPWYRGALGEAMQPEAQALCEVVRERLLPHRFSLALDCHSGFGTRDRLWFPYARTRRPVACLPELYALRSLFRSTHPHHSLYTIEPQSQHYTTHGDLWDYLYDESRVSSERLFLPLTLELGSWLWVKKSPSQIFSPLGLFNPMAPHRHQRTLRQHLTLLDFLIRASVSHERWRPASTQRQRFDEAARAYWYPSSVLVLGVDALR